jgi:hypothetical protein
MDNVFNFQSEPNAYTYISQANNAFSRYLQLKIEATAIDNNLNTANRQFDLLPIQQNISAVQELWNKKIMVMQQISQIINTIAINLKEATKLVLASMQMNIATNNEVSIILSDNTISSIYSYLEQSPIKLYLQTLYKQYCINENIPMQISDIEIKTRLKRINTPYFDKLKVIIRGY